jgi:hypothetical protein
MNAGRTHERAEMKFSSRRRHAEIPVAPLRAPAARFDRGP